MQYRFYGNRLQLIKYEITAKNITTGTDGTVIERTVTTLSDGNSNHRR